MAKKKNARQTTTTRRRANATPKPSAASLQRELQEDKRAIKTLLKGMLGIALLSMFFGLKWEGKSAFERLFGGEEPVSAAKR